MISGAVAPINNPLPGSNPRNGEEADMSAGALLVTDGTIVAYCPEIYPTRRDALRGAENWASLLAQGGAIERPFDGRIEAGGRDIRLVAVDDPSVSPEDAASPLVVSETPWDISAEFSEGDETSISVALRAKRVRFPGGGGKATYEVEVSWTRTDVYKVELPGPTGLDRDGVEALVGDHLVEVLLADSDLIESDWILHAYQERD